MRRAPLAGLLLLALAAGSARAQELPSEPGYLWDPAESLVDAARDRIAAAAKAASRTSGQRILVVTSRPKSLEEADAFAARAAEAWPDRTLVVVLRSDWTVHVVPSASARPMLGEARVEEFQRRIERRYTEHDFDLSLCSILQDLGETLAGRPPTPWVEWRHPLQLLTGGQDTRGAPLPLGIGVAATLALFVLLFLRALWRNPRGVLARIAVEGAEFVIGGLLSGGGGGGGSSFSGGGGSSGGGGASGSW